jgi:hypothetical protein
MLARARVKPLIDKGMMLLNQRDEDLMSDLLHFKDLLRVTGKESTHAHWLALKIAEMTRAKQEHHDFAIETNRFQLIENERMELMEMDLSFLDMLNKQPDFVKPEDDNWIRQILGDENASNNTTSISRETLEAIIDRYQQRVNVPPKRNKELFEHLIRRIRERLREV